jgi:hypothetical protein
MLINAMRSPPCGTGAGDHALDKHHRQPASFASPLKTQSVRSALALRSILVVAGQTQRAQPRPHRGQKSARVRYQCLIVECGWLSDSIGEISVVKKR